MVEQAKVNFDGTAAPTELARRFDTASSAFSRLRHRQHALKHDASWSAEAIKRIEQLAWIIRRVHHIHLHLKRPPKRFETRRRTETEIELLVETFYYAAWRLRELLRNQAWCRKFDPIGVRAVRNHLLEHPHQYGAVNQSFTYGHDLRDGPRLKPFGPHNLLVTDPGLYRNALELLEQLEPRLAAAEQSMNSESAV